MSRRRVRCRDDGMAGRQAVGGRGGFAASDGHRRTVGRTRRGGEVSRRTRRASVRRAGLSTTTRRRVGQLSDGGTGGGHRLPDGGRRRAEPRPDRQYSIPLQLRLSRHHASDARRTTRESCAPTPFGRSNRVLTRRASVSKLAALRKLIGGCTRASLTLGSVA